MRGTPASSRYRSRIAGIIPAYAGNTVMPGSVTLVYRDHPRVCGEHLITIMSILSMVGSSPRMRGTLFANAEYCAVKGIIPAYAGNTRRSACLRCVRRDHPRVCGEHILSSFFISGVSGSSPRMRGTHRRNGEMRHAGGIIPAYAGNTNSMFIVSSLVGDHPRVCGEHSCGFQSGGRHQGSSPRMRGTLRVEGQGSMLPGIIPAYAGNTATCAPADVVRKDHPRVCGEHLVMAANNLSNKGSSPRMRGTPRSTVCLASVTGIIPAYAGNTSPAATSSCGCRDHPRVCGEHRREGRASSRLPGSSPRMRGTRH